MYVIIFILELVVIVLDIKLHPNKLHIKHLLFTPWFPLNKNTHRFEFFMRSYHFFPQATHKCIGRVHHIPETYHIPDNLGQQISNHIWLFFCFVDYLYKVKDLNSFNTNDFYYLKVIKIKLEWPWSDLSYLSS